MSFVPSLLQAIVRVDGEAVVFHVGEKPYVVTPTGQVDLATRGLSFDAVTGILNQLLPTESQHALDELGAVQYELPPAAELPAERFTIVAAHGGDDVWVEIRRRRVADDQVPLEVVEEAPEALDTMTKPPSGTAPRAGAGATPPATAPRPDAMPDIPAAEQLFPASPLPASAAPAAPEPIPAPVALPIAAPVSVPDPDAAPAAAVALHRPPAPVVPIAPVAVPPVDHRGPFDAAPAPQPAAVLPLMRSPIRTDGSGTDSGGSSLERLLRQAAGRGAAVLYLSSGARPALRVDGDVQTFDGAPVLGATEVETLLSAMMPARNVEALRAGIAGEWMCDLPDLGLVRCQSFRDSRGPGAVFRFMPTQAATAEQLGLSREILALLGEAEGLLIVSGPRSSGKRTLIAAIVDLLNRVRRDHVITIERVINVTHERGGSFISQREVHGGADEMLAAARAALREDPDVLVLEEVRTSGLMTVALEAAAAGQLVIAGVRAPSATGAVDRIIDLYPTEDRRAVQLSLAHHLRGVIAQVLLRRSGGGRVAAREVLLNTPAVRDILAEGSTAQLPLAIEAGRAHGMAPMNDALVGYVQGGIVEVQEAYGRAADREGFLALLKRHGLDASTVEKYG